MVYDKFNLLEDMKVISNSYPEYQPMKPKSKIFFYCKLRKIVLIGVTVKYKKWFPLSVLARDALMNLYCREDFINGTKNKDS